VRVERRQDYANNLNAISRDISWECAFGGHIGRAIRRNVGASISESGYPLLLGMNFPKRTSVRIDWGPVRSLKAR